MIKIEDNKGQVKFIINDEGETIEIQEILDKEKKDKNHEQEEKSKER